MVGLRRSMKRILVGMLFSLCLTGLFGCSDETYHPSGETLFLSEGTDTFHISTGAVLEIPDTDPFARAPHVLRVDFLNTGESDAILLRAEDWTCLVDTGEADDFGRIAWALDSYRITSLNCLILTHFDNDHIGSAAQILRKYAVERVYMPDYVRDSVTYRRMVSALELLSDTEVHCVTEDTVVEIPNGQLRINPTKLYEAGITLGSDDEHALEENNFSLITSVKFGEIDLLLPGDAEQERLVEFLDRGESADYDLIKIPHHGKYDKALGNLLRESEELRYCVIHAGAAAHVEASLTTAVRSTGAAAYYTYGGDVHFATDGVSMIVEQD